MSFASLLSLSFMQNRCKKIIFSFTAILFVLLPQVSLAQGLKDAFGTGSPLSDVKTKTGYSDEDIGAISGRVINTALTIVGVVFLLLMVYAGYLWMTAQGEESKIDKAQNIIKGTVIGLVLVLSAYAITIFVTRGLNPSAPASVASCKDTIPPTTLPPGSGPCASFGDGPTCPSWCVWQ